MISLWNETTAATATHGETTGTWEATSVAIDSRSLKPGALFVAIKGERVDGHQYVKQAFENSASAAIVSEPVSGVDASRLLVVEETTKALENLGMAARARSHATIIGVTGSVGKTTTKEALRTLLSSYGKTFATAGNLNNHYGTPLSLANLPIDAEYGVFEMGMNHGGEIAALTRQVRPHIAIITTVEAVHLEFFKDEQGIADAKAEIFEGLENQGIAILNADNRHTPYIVEKLRKTSAEIIRFGQSPIADLQLTSRETTMDGEALHVRIGASNLAVNLQSVGQAMVSAALVCLSVAHALKFDAAQAAKFIQRIGEVEGRGQITAVTLGGKNMWWMDDSYNASPASMKAAFEKLSHAKQKYKASRSVAVLGDMLELGEKTAELHAGLAEPIQSQHIDEVFLAGSLMQSLKNLLPNAHYFDNIESMQPALKEALQAGDVVLFKGSHGSNIHQLVKQLLPGS